MSPDPSGGPAGAGPPPAPKPSPGQPGVGGPVLPARDGLVVAHMLDGRVVKGRSLDVSPDKPLCHVITGEGPVKVSLADLKALFFVRDLQGDAGYQEHQSLDPKDIRSRGARLLAVRFRDGERLVGLAPTYQPTRPYFFLVPVDPQSNNLRVLVNRAAAEFVEIMGAGG